MFHIPRLNVIESDAGFSVEILGRTGLDYHEADRKMFIESEVLMTEPPSIAIWKDHINAWAPPYEKESVSEETRLRILKNISAALKWRNVQLELHSRATGWVKGWLE